MSTFFQLSQQFVSAQSFQLVHPELLSTEAALSRRPEQGEGVAEVMAPKGQAGMHRRQS
jgi:hypothetical protein